MKILIILFILFKSSICCWIYYVLEAKLFEEYANSFFGAVMIGITTVDFLMLIWKSEKIFKFIRTFEYLIEKSNFITIVNHKYNLQGLYIIGLIKSSSSAMYEKPNHQVERWSEVLKLALLNITTHFMIWPIAIISYFTYFTTDLGEDSFELPFYIW